MYKHFIRPILFLFNPEGVHRFAVSMLKFVGKLPGGRCLLRKAYTYSDPILEKEVFGIKFPNPVGLAAGFDKNANYYKDVSTLGFGFIEVGTVTPKAQPGNPYPRCFRLKKDKALINRMGFNNKGVEYMTNHLRDKQGDTIIGVNLGKNTLTPNENASADYLKMFRTLYQYADYFVINVSCPNIKDLSALQNRKSVMKILEGLFDFRRGQNVFRPILLKISPDLSKEQIDEMIDILMSTPLDGLVAVNTTISREGLNTKNKIVKAIGNGGLSGAPLTERAIEVVKYLNEKTEGRYPIIGVGGIMTPEDAQRMLDAGADLIQVYTGFIYEGPAFVNKICKHLKNVAEQRAFQHEISAENQSHPRH